LVVGPLDRQWSVAVDWLANCSNAMQNTSLYIMAAAQSILAHSKRAFFVPRRQAVRQRKIRVFVSSPCNLLREGVQAIFRSEPGVHIAGAAATAQATVAKVKSLHPDAVLLDIAFKDSPAVDVVRRIRENDSRVLILISTLSDAVDQIADCIEAGACGYVSKDVSSSVLLSVIQKQVERVRP
jgi:CheY-like chemotaxis protein